MNMGKEANYFNYEITFIKILMNKNLKLTSSNFFITIKSEFNQIKFLNLANNFLKKS